MATTPTAVDDERAGRPLDLVIFDLNLPGEGGLSLVLTQADAAGSSLRALRGEGDQLCVDLRVV